MPDKISVRIPGGRVVQAVVTDDDELVFDEVDLAEAGGHQHLAFFDDEPIRCVCRCPECADASGLCICPDCAHNLLAEDR